MDEQRQSPIDGEEQVMELAAQAADQTGAAPEDIQAATALAFERQVEQASALLLQNPLYRPALYRILQACTATPVRVHELEQAILAMPEFAKATQPPYALIEWLLDAKAIEQHDLDEQGIEVTDEQKAGKSEDEIDDLVADYAFQTNEVGLAVIAEFKPLNRLAGLLESVPERYDTYREVLEFLRVRRSMLEVDNLLRGRDILMSGRNPDDRPMQPSVFIDKLAAAGAILYNEGWQLSIDGEEFLAAIEKEERGA